MICSAKVHNLLLSRGVYSVGHGFMKRLEINETSLSLLKVVCLPLVETGTDTAKITASSGNMSHLFGMS